MSEEPHKKPWYALNWNLILWGIVLGIVLHLCC